MSSPPPDGCGDCLDTHHSEGVSETIMSQWVCDGTLRVGILPLGPSLPWEMGGILERVFSPSREIMFDPKVRVMFPTEGVETAREGAD